MERRRFLKSLAAIAGLATAGVVTHAPTYGYLDPTNCLAVTGHRQESVRIAFNGAAIDLAEWRVLACDDRAGYVDVLKRDARHAFYLDPRTGHWAREKRSGRVVVTFQDA